MPSHTNNNNTLPSSSSFHSHHTPFHPNHAHLPLPPPPGPPPLLPPHSMAQLSQISQMSHHAPKMPFLFPAAAAAAAAHFSMASLTSNSSANRGSSPTILASSSSKSPTGESASSPASNSSSASGGVGCSVGAGRTGQTAEAGPESPIKPGAGLGLPPSHFFHSQNILTLLADRTHDLWAKAAVSQPLSAHAFASAGAPPAAPVLPMLPFATATNGSASPPAVQPPSLTSGHIPNWENLQETTARLLFMAVRWVKCLVPFQTLSVKDQVRKMRNIGVNT